MDAIFLDPKDSKKSDSQEPLLNFTDKINYKRSHKYVVVLHNLRKKLKRHPEKRHWKYQLQREMINFNYHTSDILYKRFELVLSI